VAKELPFAGALIKKEQDMEVLEAAMKRGGNTSPNRLGLRSRF
jgi:hypothetical protein